MKTRIVVTSDDDQYYVIIDKIGFRDWRIAFFHDSVELALSITHAYCEGLAVIKAKEFVANRG